MQTTNPIATQTFTATEALKAIQETHSRQMQNRRELNRYRREHYADTRVPVRDRSPTRSTARTQRVQEQCAAIEARKCDYPNCLGLGFLIDGVCPGEGYTEESDVFNERQFMHCERCGLLFNSENGRNCDSCGCFHCDYICCEEDVTDGAFVDEARGECKNCPRNAPGYNFVCSPCFVANPQFWCDNADCEGAELPESLQKDLVAYSKRSVCCAAIELLHDSKPSVLVRVLRSIEEQKATLITTLRNEDKPKEIVREAKQLLRGPLCVERACVQGRQAIADLRQEGYSIKQYTLCSCGTTDDLCAPCTRQTRPYRGGFSGTEGFLHDEFEGSSAFGYFDDIK